MRAALLALIFLLNACAPLLPPLGENPGAPSLTDKGLRTRDGMTLPVRKWMPTAWPKGVVIALHGFNDYSNAFKESGAYLASKGLVVFAIDQRGFGRAPHRGLWAGHEVMAHDLTDLAKVLRGKYMGLPLYLLGESMGGAVVMVAVTGNDPPPHDGVILAAPAGWGRDTMPWYQDVALALSTHTVPWVTVTGRGLKRVPSDNIEMLRALGRDPLVIKETRIDAVHGLVDLMDAAQAATPKLKSRALVLYGIKDEIIPTDPVLKMANLLPFAGRGQTLAFYPKGYHMLLRDLQAKKVLDDIAAWAVDPNKPLPSGVDANGIRFLGPSKSP
ncbi:MAG: hypothetical protein A2516_05995 [Alphaproteobacteria bacterium RIFOXYD12_FULL_60_8]|nr:MAG: hypothetical protein A2516_05995 [Alphaproteobacteria bacterium RIFOXYD12_FULL_60_8]